MNTMPKRQNLPCVMDAPRDAFRAGWFAGIGVGFITGIAVAVMVASSLGKI